MIESDDEPVLTLQQQEELEDNLHKASNESRIPCASVLALAESMGIPPAEVGKTANKLRIRIKKCQLGCF